MLNLFLLVNSSTDGGVGIQSATTIIGGGWELGGCVVVPSLRAGLGVTKIMQVRVLIGWYRGGALQLVRVRIVSEGAIVHPRLHGGVLIGGGKGLRGFPETLFVVLGLVDGGRKSPRGLRETLLGELRIIGIHIAVPIVPHVSREEGKAECVWMGDGKKRKTRTTHTRFTAVPRRGTASFPW